MKRKKDKLLDTLIYFYIIVGSNCFFANQITESHIPKIFLFNMTQLVETIQPEILKYISQEEIVKRIGQNDLEAKKAWEKRVGELEEEYKKIRKKGKKEKSVNYIS